MEVPRSPSRIPQELQTMVWRFNLRRLSATALVLHRRLNNGVVDMFPKPDIPLHTYLRGWI